MPTEVDIGVPGAKLPRIGERINSDLDKVHRFLTYFINESEIQVPNVPGYNFDVDEDIFLREQPERRITTKESKNNLKISLLKSSTR